MSSTLRNTMQIDEQARRRFERAWRNHQPCSIEDCLPDPASHHFLETLEELVLIDIEYQWERFYRRWNAGGHRQGNYLPHAADRPPAVSSYLQRFPELRSPEIEERLAEQEECCRQPDYHQPLPVGATTRPGATSSAMQLDPQPRVVATRDRGISWGDAGETSVLDAGSDAPCDPLLHMLRQVSLFQLLPERTLGRISRNVREVCCDTGDVILTEGRRSPGLFVIIDGQARVECAGEVPGTTVVLNDVGSGDVLGEMSLMTGRPCAATVRATTRLRMLHLTASDSDRLAHDVEGFSVACLQLLSSRLGRNPQDALCGKRIGDYRFLSVLGRGASGIVYRAQHLPAGETVAVKMLNPMLACDRGAVARFQREAEILRRIDHPHIVRLIDEFRADNTLFLVTGFCSGGSLAEMIARTGSVESLLLKRIAGQLAGALQAAHSRGITHRDLKPANVFIADEDHARLGDFSIAYLDGATRLTAGQCLLGTPRYMAPEQLMCEPAGPPADVFSLGCVVFEMATGRPLFQGRTHREILAQHFSGTVHTDALQGIADQELQGFLYRSLQPQPQDRHVDLSSLVKWARPANLALCE